MRQFCNRAGFLCLALLCCFSAGCGGKPEARYTPKANTAQEALTEVLEKWKSGDKYGRIEDWNVPIDVFESRWKAGKKLESYEILPEETSEGVARVLVVKMKLIDDKEEKEVKYFIVGIDPLLVFQEDDYNKANSQAPGGM